MFWRRRRERDLDHEIRGHLDLECEEQRDAGLPPDEARYAARRVFGNTSLVKETVREMWGWTSLERLIQDLRYAARMLRRNLGFAAVIIASLALGIGANTTIFSLLNTVLLKSLPVTEPARLVVLGTETGVRLSYPMIEVLRARSAVFAGLFTYQHYELTMIAGSSPDRVRAELVSGDYFPALGVRAWRGRTLTEEDNLRGDPRAVAMLSFRFWRERLGADPDVVGRTVRVNSYPVTIVGILPRGFFGTEVGQSPDLWMPIRLMNSLSLPGRMLDDPDAVWLPAMARLAPGITREQAQAAGDAVYRHALGERRQHLVLLSGARGLSRLQQQFSRPLVVLMALVGLVLFIACANAANLLLARAASRRKEIAIRLAIGAGRGRLIGQLLAESLLLALAAGGFGLLGASIVAPAIVKMLPAARNLTLDLDWRVAQFCLAACLVTGIGFGLIPALHASRPVAAVARGRRFGFRQVLMIAQVSLSVMLLIAATLLARTLQQLRASDTGFHAEHLLQASLNPRQAGRTPAQTIEFYARLLDRVRNMDGVRAASFSGSEQMLGNVGRIDFYPTGYQPRPDEDVFSIFEIVEPRFFETMGIPILQGRDFSPQDGRAAPKVMIINEAMARYFFGGGNPVGRLIGEAGAPERRIVGVVGATKYRNMRERPPRIVYLPFAQMGPASARTLYARVEGDPRRIMADVRAAVEQLDREVPVYGVKLFTEQLDQAVAQERITAWLAGAFGLLALSLACIGLYGVTNYGVTQRTREIGIRVAVGAQQSQVLRMVLRETLGLTLAGIGLGLGGALACSHFLGSLLYGLTAVDRTAFLLATVVMLASAAAAAYVPARRASRVAPLVALRYE
jgi:predicted permease